MQPRSLLPDSCFYGWLFTLAWAPLPMASNRPWALALLIFLIAVLTLYTCAVAIVFKRPVGPALSRFLLPIMLLFVVALWSTIQFIPLSLNLLDTLSPIAAQAYEQAGMETGRLTLDVGRTQVQAAYSWALWLFFCLSLLLLDSPERVRRACLFIVYCGVFQALYGSFMTLSGIEYGFFVEKTSYRGVATGTFVNRNHLAGYLEMCLALGVGLLVASLSNRAHRNWRSRLRSMLDAMLGAKIRLRIYLALMVIALVLTHSRMGNTAFFASLMIGGCFWMVLQRRVHKGAIVLFVSLVLIDTLIVGQWFGFEEVVERMENTSTQRETRDEVVRDSLVMLKDFKLTGSGLGSYNNAFPRYQQNDVAGYMAVYDHAHNDYLQFAIELGLLAMVPLAALVLLAFGKAMTVVLKRRDNLAKGVGFAVMMGILALMIHSSVDFNLQIPANALLFIVILSLAWVAGRLPHASNS